MFMFVLSWYSYLLMLHCDNVGDSLVFLANEASLLGPNVLSKLFAYVHAYVLTCKLIFLTLTLLMPTEWLSVLIRPDLNVSISWSIALEKGANDNYWGSLNWTGGWKRIYGTSFLDVQTSMVRFAKDCNLFYILIRKWLTCCQTRWSSYLTISTWFDSEKTTDVPFQISQPFLVQLFCSETDFAKASNPIYQTVFPCWKF